MDDEKILTENTYPFTWDFVDESGNLISISTQNQGISKEQLDQAINNGLNTINLSGDGLKYILSVNGKNAGEINIPKDQFLKNVVYNRGTKALAFTFETSDGVKTTTIDLSDLADMYSAGNGIKIENGVISCTYVIPTKVSELENDADFATKSELPTVPTNISAFTNDAGYLTEHQSLDGYATEQWVGDKKYLTEHQDISGKLDKSVYDADKVTFETIVHAEATYQPKGDYAFKSDLETKADVSLLDTYATKTSLEGVNTMATETAQKMDDAEKVLETVVNYDVIEESYGVKNRKVITFDNAELIQAKANTEELEGKVPVVGTVTLMQLNRWNVVDLGSTKTITNINTPKGYRPTVQEEGQSGIEANQIAYVGDVEQIKEELIASEYDSIAKFDMINTSLNELTSKINSLYKTNTEVISVEGTAPTMDDNAKSYIVSGEITGDTVVNAKTIEVLNSTLNDTRFNINASDIEFKDVKINGEYPKGSSNTIINVNKNRYINFKDVVFDPTASYNAIEASLLVTEKKDMPISIVFDNCDFTKFGNNAINIHGTDDNAIITLNNCHFGDVSNCLRLSNRSNANGVIVNVNNCTVDKWYEGANYAGFLLCQDYTSKTVDEANINNLFGNGKITINFNNLKYKGEVIKPTNIADICGTGEADQVVYVYYDKGGFIKYDENKYPIINFN